MTREQIIDACHFDEPEQILAYIEELEAKIAKLEGGVVEKYQELLHEIRSKFEDETTHETALRYIRKAESGDNDNVESSTQLQ